MQKSYLKRIIKEKKKLNKKIDKLMTFIMCDPEFGKLSDEYQSLLHAQSSAMITYGSILSTRIAIAESEEDEKEYTNPEPEPLIDDDEGWETVEEESFDIQSQEAVDEIFKKVTEIMESVDYGKK